ncbi:hypothetical protein FAEPRAA2165_03364 [Faecalibacterium duncaniae]|uniref:UvrD-like helicase ATP-binding domain-containing protein n=1 Tax=Faecalibacterium duncaniae (strain DSM 17677 / JCM 31915 / A2-165) TaxID=411483 RepID=C7HAP8_FAED2|nr:hypothetical protein FAEPRAA2165_03364 [Faecalibacterium duncaniae]
MAASLQQEFCALRDTYIEKQFGRLNDMQRQAVFTTDGPLLILAGAGSGKTTVLVNRIANLIRFGSAHGSSWTPREVTEDDVKALKTAIMTGTDAPAWLDGMLRQNAVRSWNVMAITFTNKAAGELKERLRNMLGGEEGDEVFASTFHSACVRILRRWAESIGYPRSFTIYDTDDSQRVMKAVYKELSIDDKFFPIKSAINQMSRWKDQLVSPEEALRTPARDTKGAIAAKVYAAYEKKTQGGRSLRLRRPDLPDRAAAGRARGCAGVLPEQVPLPAGGRVSGYQRGPVPAGQPAHRPGKEHLRCR